MNDIETNKQKLITACIDGSGISASVVDTAAWASKTLGVPLNFLHVLEKALLPVVDRSGAIMPGSATDLLDELTELDEKRGKVAMALGRHMLDEAAERARGAGVEAVSTQQRHGDLLDALLTCEPDTQLFVIGRLGEDHENHTHKLGAHLESIVRAIHTPTLVAVGQFEPPKSYMIAYDGSDTADKTIAGIANTAVLQAMLGQVVMVGADNDANRRSLDKAVQVLAAKGHEVSGHLVQGSVVEQLLAFRAEHSIGLMVMGAYGHSRVREFFVGSNTSKMILSSAVPLLLLR